MAIEENKIVRIRAPMPERWQRAKDRIAEIKANQPTAPAPEPKGSPIAEH